MGLLDLFSGKSQANWAKSGGNAFRDGLNKGREFGMGHLGNGYQVGTSALNQGYSHAASNIVDGMRNATNVSRSFTDGARDDLTIGANASRDAINSGASNAQGHYQTALNRLAEIYDPMLERGNAAGDAYQSFLGLNGGDAQRGVYEQYYDPTRDFRNEQIQRALDSRANAAGYGGSGRAGLATSRALNESQYQDMENYGSRLERASNQGQAAAGQYAGFQNPLYSGMAGVSERQGFGLANIETGLGRNLANANMTQGQLEARINSNNAINNGSLSINYGKDIANLGTAYHGNLAQLDQGTETAIGQSYLNEHNAVSQAKQTGLNNMIGLGTGLASLATGMPLGGFGGGSNSGGGISGGLSGLARDGTFSGFQQGAAGMHSPQNWNATVTPNQNYLGGYF